MRKKLRKVIIPVGIVLLLIIILGGFWLWYSRRAHPRVSGTIRVDGLTAPVEIYRDKNGIPHIYAQTDEDLFFGQGFIHAQDRFWQMEFWRRIGSGRLAELFGEEVLGTDIYLRTMGFARLAEQEYAKLDDESRRILDAYAAGVNAYILNRKASKLGLEFSLLKLKGVEFEIEPWTPVNSLTWIKVMSQDQGSNMEDELAYIDRIRTVGISMAADFLAPYREEEMPYIVSDDELIVTSSGPKTSGFVSLTEEQVLALQNVDTGLVGGFDPVQGLVFGRHMSIGSNNWVISGALTSTKMPLLANDVHLGIQMPSIWYENSLHCTGVESTDCTLNLRGFSFPGLPGVIIGHNEHIAWGVTNLYPDVQDLYIERINPENPNQYEVNGKWVDMEIIHEKITIHDEDEPYGLLIRSTRHGPIVTDHGFMLDYSSFGITPQKVFPENLEFTALSLRWTGLQPCRTFKAIIMLDRAHNFDEFREALRYWEDPSMNFVYADVDGNIAYQAPGLIPIRKSGEGFIPAPGWTDDFEWVGYIPFDELPSVYNPAKGYIVTANNPVVSRTYPYLIATEFSQGYRARRIVDMIKEDSDGISIDDMKSMQGDDLNLSALEVLPYIKNINFDDLELETAKDFLSGWDGRMDMNSPQAALYGYFWQKLIEKTFKDQLIEKTWPPQGSRLLSLIYKLLQDPENAWWNDVTTLEVIETRDDILKSAFEKAYKAGTEELSDELEDWRWGDIHIAIFRNMTFGKSGIAPIEVLFNRGPVAVSGGIYQVNRTDWKIDEPFQAESITSMRQIIDLGNFSNSLMMHTTGQSGHPTHRHYDNFIELWRNIQYHLAFWERSEVEENSKKRLILKPEK